MLVTTTSESAVSVKRYTTSLLPPKNVQFGRVLSENGAKSVTVKEPPSMGAVSAVSQVSPGGPASEVDPPSAVDPPAVDPPALDPPAVDPPAFAPPAVDPPAVDPPADDPPAFAPPAVEP